MFLQNLEMWSSQHLDLKHMMKEVQGVAGKGVAAGFLRTGAGKRSDRGWKVDGL